MFNKSKTANAVRTLFVGRSNKNKHGSAVAKWAYSTEVQQVKQKKPKEKLIILGGGWAGFRIIKDIDLEKYEVSVVSPRNHFLFTPLLPSTMSGTLEFRSIIEPIRRARAHQDYHYYESHCEGIDTEKKLVYCNPNHVDDKPFTLTYDKLIVCVGCDVNSFGIKGVKEHAYFLKELTDARKLRGKIIECFERAANPNTPIYMREKLLHFVIVGAGPTGVEAAAELQDLIDQDLKKIFPEHIHLDVKITILEAGNNILSMFDSGLQRYTQRFFYRKKIQIYMGAKVSEVKSENLVVLADGSEIECGFVLWSAGIQPRHVVWHKNQAVASQAIAAAAEKPSEATPTTVVTATALAVEDKQLHNLPLEQRSHRILVDDHLQVKGTPNVFAIGDCSFVESKPMAQTAQVAQQQAKYLVNMLNTIAKAEDSSVASAVPFVYHHQGTMAYLGGFRAISQLVSGRFGISLQGLIAFLFYRSAYLTKLVSIKNKILVPADWLKTLLFGRDVSRF